jgi:hypothetical protein
VEEGPVAVLLQQRGPFAELFRERPRS